MNKKLFFLFAILIIALFLQETPYLNIFVVNKIWIVYFIIFFALFPLKQSKILFYSIFSILFLALISSLLNLYNFAEFFGNLLYFFLFWILIIKTYYFIKAE